jgi:hypothetical protein
MWIKFQVNGKRNFQAQHLLFPFSGPITECLFRKEWEIKVDAVHWAQESCDGGPSLYG